MSITAVIERVQESPIVEWTASADSAPVKIEGGSAFKIFLPTGTTGMPGVLKFKLVGRDGDGDAITKLIAHNGTDLQVSCVADKFNTVPVELFGGHNQIVFTLPGAYTGKGRVCFTS